MGDGETRAKEEAALVNGRGLDLLSAITSGQPPTSPPLLPPPEQMLMPYLWWECLAVHRAPEPSKEERDI